MARQFYRLKILHLEEYIKGVEGLGDAVYQLLPNQIASVNNSIAIGYCDLEEYETAITFHTKALKVLSSQTVANPTRDALYLFNFGVSCFRPLEAEIGILANNPNYDREEAIRVTREVQPVAACFWEAKDILEKAGLFTNSELTLKILCFLIDALFYSANPENMPILRSYYSRLEPLISKFPARDGDVILQKAAQLRDMVLDVSPASHPVESENQQRFQAMTSLVEAEFEHAQLNLLAIFYTNRGVSMKFKERIAAAEAKLKLQNPHDLSLRTRLGVQVSSLINQASILLRSGAPRKALRLYLQAKQNLHMQEFYEFFPGIYGDLLESIADTYVALNNPRQAFRYFAESLDAHGQYGPNERSFHIVTKISKPMVELCGRDKALIELKPIAEKALNNFQKFTGEGDSRLAGMKFIIALCDGDTNAHSIGMAALSPLLGNTAQQVFVKDATQSGIASGPSLRPTHAVLYHDNIIAERIINSYSQLKRKGKAKMSDDFNLLIPSNSITESDVITFLSRYSRGRSLEVERIDGNFLIGLDEAVVQRVIQSHESRAR